MGKGRAAREARRPWPGGRGALAIGRCPDEQGDLLSALAVLEILGGGYGSFELSRAGHSYLPGNMDRVSSEASPVCREKGLWEGAVDGGGRGRGRDVQVQHEVQRGAGCSL
jgi:hypothetical protein